MDEALQIEIFKIHSLDPKIWADKFLELSEMGMDLDRETLMCWFAAAMMFASSDNAKRLMKEVVS